MMEKRSSGVLMHISSLPSQDGIGDLGWSSTDFIDFLSKAGQKYWQFLPTGPGDLVYGCSPYMGLSAVAGNPLLISLDLLQDDELLTIDDLSRRGEFSEYLIDFSEVIDFKKRMLALAYKKFVEKGEVKDFHKFCRQEAGWLDDYSLFMSLRDVYDYAPWYQWADGLVSREAASLKAASEKYSSKTAYYKFEQYCFFKQWVRMRSYAKSKGVSLIGDIPIYVSFDSVDVWANPKCFDLDEQSHLPNHVAGVPPDYFSATGQRWGNPLYKWKIGKIKNQQLYEWWRQRFLQIAKQVDVVRIDHFRAFESYWQVPASEKTAENGSWQKGPGSGFFKDMQLDKMQLAIIAEDLGIITPAVEKLRDTLGFPGMKILQFAFDSDNENLYLPHNFKTTNCVVYTGTHDNNTTLGWEMDAEVPVRSKIRARRYANSSSDGQISWDFIRMAFSSVAALAILPLQDILGFGGDCRMNVPSTTEGNWRWRCAPKFLNDEVCSRLRDETEFYGRLNREEE